MGKTQLTGYKTCRTRYCRNGASAFTLVEAIIATSVIAVLSTLTVVAVSKAREQAESTRSISAAKALINAFLLHGAENNNVCFIGYDQRAGRDGFPIWYQGRQITNAEAPHRYPFRLAQYLNDEFQGAIFVGENLRQMSEMQGGTDDYSISLYPAFGMNFNFVGGYMSINGQYTGRTQQDAVLTHYEDASQLIVFASSAIRIGTKKINGFHEIKPPNFYGSHWAPGKWRENSNPGNYGNVDARFNNQAIVAMMDGSVHMRTIEELRDMRLWSRTAKEQNDSNFEPYYKPVFER